MSGLALNSKQSASCQLTSAACGVGSSANAALAQCAALIAAEPELAAMLAAIQPADRFLGALEEFARQHGITLESDAKEIIVGNRSVALGCRITAWPFAARRGWQPFVLEWGPLGAELVWGCGAEHADAAFHESTVADLRARPLNRLFAVRTPLTPEFTSALEADALPIRGLIFHMSRCGSTLIGQALKAWPSVRVLSEPGLLDIAITLAYSGNDPDWRLFRAVLAALAQPAGDERCVVIKLDAWHALALAQILQRVPAGWLFVYRNPAEVMVSHAREPGRHTVPGMLPEAWLGTSRETADQMSSREHGARVIGAICAAIVPYARAPNLLNYDELPQALRTRVADSFGFDRAAADPAKLDALLAVHAKRPYEPFADDRMTKRKAADASLRAAVERWIAPHYTALETIRHEGRA